MHDPVNGRYKAFLFVGVAYFLTAVLAPLAVLWLKGATWSFSPGGVAWSVVAGIVGAVGAFGVLLAFGAKGTPAVVMSIVFAGAPVLNAIYSLVMHPPAGGWQKLPLPFVLGIVMAAIGGCLVTLYKPAPGAPRSSRPSPRRRNHSAAPPPVSRCSRDCGATMVKILGADICPLPPGGRASSRALTLKHLPEEFGLAGTLALPGFACRRLSDA